MFYAKLINKNQIIKIRKGGSYGAIRFGKKSKGEAYQKHGFYPLVKGEPIPQDKVPTSSTYIFQDGKVIETTHYRDYTPEEIQEQRERKKISLINEFESLVAQKHQGAEKLLADKDISIYDREQYKAQFSDAKLFIGGVKDVEVVRIAILHIKTPEEVVGDAKIALTVPALEKGLSVEDYARDIISTGGDWSKATKIFYGLIKSVSRRFYKVVDVDIDRARELTEEARGLGLSEEELSPADTIQLTMQQVVGLLGKYTV